MSVKQLINFTSDLGGLDKILRLIQALAQILAAVSIFPEDIKTYSLVKTQLVLGRRYLRLFKFFDAYSKALSCFLSTSGVELLLGVGKWSFLGSYLLLESTTILDAMNVHPTPFAKMCFIEANKLWFYSLVCSILLSLVQIFNRDSEPAVKKAPSEKDDAKSQVKARSKRAKEAERRIASNEKWRRNVRAIVTDASDLFLPGVVTGWLVTGPVTLGVATVISTTLSSKDVWDKFGDKK